MDHDRKSESVRNSPPAAEKRPASNPSVNELYARLRSEMPSPKSDQEAIAAAMQMIRRLETQNSAEEAVRVAAKAEVTMGNACHACGGENRPGNAFCGSCGVPLRVSPGEESAAKLAQPAGQHHYHHHYHHYGVAADGFAAPVGDTRAAAPARPRAAVGDLCSAGRKPRCES